VIALSKNRFSRSSAASAPIRSALRLTDGLATAITPSTGASNRLPASISTNAPTDQRRPCVADNSAVTASTPATPRMSPNTVTTSQVPGDSPAGSELRVGQPHIPLSA